MWIPKTKYEKLRVELKKFTLNLEYEKDETKEAFYLLNSSIKNNKKLTKEEKKIIGNQLKDVFKTLGLVGIAILPGGTLIFIFTKVFKMNHYILPSSFNNKNKK